MLCHCSVNYNALKSTAKRRQQGAEQKLCTNNLLHHCHPKERATQSVLPSRCYIISHMCKSECLYIIIMSYPLMISLHSARMKCSLSGVRMHSEFFCPVLDSPSMTSEHWFILMVPWGRVLGCRTATEKVLSGEGNRRAHKSLHMVSLLTQSTPASIFLPSLAHITHTLI